MQASRLRARYRYIMWFFARASASVVFWEVLLPRLGLRGLTRQTRSARYRGIAAQFRAMAIRMGGVMIKLGQFLSARLDVLPAEITEELAGLQDEVPAEQFADIRRLAEAELGAPLGQKFERFEAERKEAGLPLEHLTEEGLDLRSLRRLLAANLGALLLLPFAAFGAFLHYPAYRLAGFLADQFARGEEDQVATIKAGSAILLFPATWVVCMAAAGALFGWKAAFAAALLAPASGYAALRARELLDVILGRARALLSAFSRRYSTRRLLVERRTIHEEILEAASELDLLPTEPPAPTSPQPS